MSRCERNVLAPSTRRPDTGVDRAVRAHAALVAGQRVLGRVDVVVGEYRVACRGVAGITSGGEAVRRGRYDLRTRDDQALKAYRLYCLRTPYEDIAKELGVGISTAFTRVADGQKLMLIPDVEEARNRDLTLIDEIIA